MFYKPLLLPLLAQVLLTFIVMFVMYSRRVSELKKKRIHPEKVKTRRMLREQLTDSANPADNFANLFEMPVLFYIAMVLALTLLISDFMLVGLAWLYVFLRYVHSFIHVTYNTVMHRFYVFAASAMVLLVIWVRLGALIIYK